mmetsp:Transcript_5382/g.12314  ORF Transcript_5382/g.12314 Transcript_5382/m.12314 type:complete len:224 (-) Transcript_5382:127-798(-)
MNNSFSVCVCAVWQCYTYRIHLRNQLHHGSQGLQDLFLFLLFFLLLFLLLAARRRWRRRRRRRCHLGVVPPLSPSHRDRNDGFRFVHRVQCPLQVIVFFVVVVFFFFFLVGGKGNLAVVPPVRRSGGKGRLPARVRRQRGGPVVAVVVGDRQRTEALVELDLVALDLGAHPQPCLAGAPLAPGNPTVFAVVLRLVREGLEGAALLFSHRCLFCCCLLFVVVEN